MIDIVEVFKQKANKVIQMEKNNKYIPLTIEQYNELMDKLTFYENNNESLKKQIESLETRLSKSKSNFSSVNAKYNSLLRKSKHEIKNELEKSVIQQIEDDIETKYHYKYVQKEWELKEKINDEIEKECNKRITRFNKMQERFNAKMLEEIDRYTNSYDVNQENNKGYLIGLMKTKKILNESFDEIRKGESKTL